jgi:hypothetical protein
MNVPAMILYVDTLPDGFAGKANGPIVRILETHRGDAGLHAHELCHVRQWWRTLGLHGILYALFDSYRLDAEVEAYREQLQHSPGNARLYSSFIASRYGLNVSLEEVLRRFEGCG